jgi:hypothetical protein
MSGEDVLTSAYAQAGFELLRYAMTMPGETKAIGMDRHEMSHEDMICLSADLFCSVFKNSQLYPR